MAKSLLPFLQRSHCLGPPFSSSFAGRFNLAGPTSLCLFSSLSLPCKFRVRFRCLDELWTGSFINCKKVTVLRVVYYVLIIIHGLSKILHADASTTTELIPPPRYRSVDLLSRPQHYCYSLVPLLLLHEEPEHLADAVMAGAGGRHPVELPSVHLVPAPFPGGCRTAGPVVLHGVAG